MKYFLVEVTFWVVTQDSHQTLSPCTYSYPGQTSLLAALSCRMCAPVMVELEGETDPLQIAMKELK